MNHQFHNTMWVHADYVRVGDHKCPICNAFLVRTPRRLVDRLWGIFKPVLRYRCQRFSCQWHGNLSKRKPDGAVPRASAQSLVREKRPVAFITLMVLALAGAILVIAVGTTEPAVFREALWIGSDETRETAAGVAQDNTPNPLALRSTAEPGTAVDIVFQAKKD